MVVGHNQDDKYQLTVAEEATEPQGVHVAKLSDFLLHILKI